MGFEPTRQYSLPTRSPGVRLKPLGHLSRSGESRNAIRIFVSGGGGIELRRFASSLVSARPEPRSGSNESHVTFRIYYNGGGGIRTHETLPGQRLSRAPP